MLRVNSAVILHILLSVLNSYTWFVDFSFKSLLSNTKISKCTFIKIKDKDQNQ